MCAATDNKPPEHIKTTVEKIEKEATQYECNQPFTYELDKCIKKAENKKEHRSRQHTK